VRLRVGNGFDVHRFSEDPARALVLGGVRFDDERGLHGHSDADVVAHAVAESLLGAAGLGDLGAHFPDHDERWRGADSLVLLHEVTVMVRADGWDVANVDCSVVAERPKLAPRRSEMESALSATVGAPVAVKGRRAEGIGGLGRGEGIACFASALLVGRDDSAGDGVAGG
jgi:2-C-methyl-D-erythritol 2,4-cyclodiphosphate synthase